MPTVKDAPMILVGHVSNVEARTSFISAEDRAKGKSSQPDGAKILVASGDGFAVVKVKQDAVNSVPVSVGDRVAWLVRPIFWEMEAGAGMSVQYVRSCDHADVDFVGSAIRPVAKSGS